MKTQQVRAVDVLILGPFMVWAGSRATSPTARLGLVVSGVATILYNYNNYLKSEENTPCCEECAKSGQHCDGRS
jgi:hypothetical protein